MTTFTPDENAPLMIEITPTSGVQEVSFSPEELAARADEVMAKVMNAIHATSEQFSHMYDSLPDQFTQVELSFGVKVTSEMGALIAKAGLEATFNVKLVWQKKS
jgi:hypothetical protein